MFSEQVLDHFQNPRNAGELPLPAITVEVSNPVCGDILRLSVRVENKILRELKFKARGCVASIACGSALTELATGKNLNEANSLSAGLIAGHLGGLPPESGHAGVLAEEALKTALQRYLSSQ